MRTYERALARVFGVPLLIVPGKAETIATVLTRRLAEGATMLEPERAPARPLMSPDLPSVAWRIGYDMRKPYPVTPHGIAVIGVEGTLVHKSMSASPPSGFITYPEIETMVRDAADDPRIRAVLLDIDSPGGEASDSAFQLAEAVRSVAAVKPVWAMADEMACSGAYLLACGATRIVMSPSGAVGSIGVVSLHLDESARDAKEGRKWTIVRAGARKYEGNSFEPPSEKFLAELHASTDRLYARFVAAVAAGRKIAEADVRATEAAVYHDGKDALAARLVDAIATPEQALDQLTRSITGATSSGWSSSTAPAAAAAPAVQPAKPAAAAAPSQETDMTDTTAAPPAPTPAPAPASAPAASAPKVEDAGTCGTCGKKLAPADDTQATAAATVAGATAERTRILAIQAHGASMPGHDKLVSDMVADPAVTADAAAARLIAAEAGKRKAVLENAAAADPKGLPAGSGPAGDNKPSAAALAAAARARVDAAAAKGQTLSVSEAMRQVIAGEPAA